MAARAPFRGGPLPAVLRIEDDDAERRKIPDCFRKPSGCANGQSKAKVPAARRTRVCRRETGAPLTLPERLSVRPLSGSSTSSELFSYGKTIRRPLRDVLQRNGRHVCTVNRPLSSSCLQPAGSFRSSIGFFDETTRARTSGGSEARRTRFHICAREELTVISGSGRPAGDLLRKDGTLQVRDASVGAPPIFRPPAEESEKGFSMTGSSTLLLPGAPPEVRRLLAAAPSVRMLGSTDELFELAFGGSGRDRYEVKYRIPEKGKVTEATVARVKNGIAVNYPEPRMRRRDPDCMLIGDELPTDKPRFASRFGYPFSEIERLTADWLSQQKLAVFGFRAGPEHLGIDAVVIAPDNAGFFLFGLALLQGVLPVEKLDETFKPRGVIYVAPPFRHTHFDGRQVVVHARGADYHRMYSFNLYPGPSAKKGVYGMLLAIGEQERWITLHCSTVSVLTPYGNEAVFLHEAPSGGGKTEMNSLPHREPDGQLIVGRNLVSQQMLHANLPRSCQLFPLTDDMATAHPSHQDGSGLLSVEDAEDGWFVRTDHVVRVSDDPFLVSLTAQPPEPLLFLNIDAPPGSRAMIIDPIEDAPGKVCSNPRVIIPRRIVPDIKSGPQTVDYRSFGVRQPPCYRGAVSFGIAPFVSVLSPGLAWLWRLAAPRGHKNPSIDGGAAMESEGVGSYWPFATGRRVDAANLLLTQIRETRATRFLLFPNQHVGAWQVSFMPQWISREFFARRKYGGPLRQLLRPTRCPLFGWTLKEMIVEGFQVPNELLQPELQPEVGTETYDEGARMLTGFFRKELTSYLTPELDPLGRRLIEACLSGCSAAEIEALLPSGAR